MALAASDVVGHCQVMVGHLAQSPINIETSVDSVAANSGTATDARAHLQALQERCDSFAAAAAAAAAVVAGTQGLSLIHI